MHVHHQARPQGDICPIDAYWIPSVCQVLRPPWWAKQPCSQLSLEGYTRGESSGDDQKKFGLWFCPMDSKICMSWGELLPKFHPISDWEFEFTLQNLSKELIFLHFLFPFNPREAFPQASKLETELWKSLLSKRRVSREIAPGRKPCPSRPLRRFLGQDRTSENTSKGFILKEI